MSRIQIRKFTPSLLDGEVLERLYVERADVLANIMSRVEQARAGEGLAHVLVVGPRGSGKTHLISLVHHLSRTADADTPISWLVEDPYDLLSYHDVIASIVSRCQPTITVAGDTTDDYEAALIAESERRGPILVLAENFDTILEQIGDVGQQRLRRLIEAGRHLHLVASTTAISSDLADQPKPFYGFFNQLRLERFTTDQAVEYLTKRAEVLEDDGFVEAITDPETAAMARRRVMSIEQLAGGQPRIWALLAEGMSIEQLDDLVSYLIDNFDDITPYYQSQLKSLAPLQRRIVMQMVRRNRAITAKTISEAIDVDARSVTKTLRDLRERGWVDVVDSPLRHLVDQRLTFYELSEPLLRLALELKDNDRREVKMIVDFVKQWFDVAEIDRSASPYAARAMQELGPDDVAMLSRWMLELPTPDTPSLVMLGEVFDAIMATIDGDGQPLFDLSSEVRRAVEARLAEEEPVELLEYLSWSAARRTCGKPSPEADRWLERHSALRAISSAHSLRSTVALVWWLGATQRFASAELAIADLLNSPVQLGYVTRSLALFGLGVSLGRAGKSEAVNVLREAVMVLERSGDKYTSFAQELREDVEMIASQMADADSP